VGENIVANLTLFNKFDAKSPIPAVLDVVLEKPILDKCSNYKMAILRFQCPLYNIRPNYIIKGQEFIVRLDDEGSTVYEESVSVSQIGNSIHEFLDVVNKLFESVWLDYVAYHPSSNFPQKAFPFLIFDPVTQLFSLVYWEHFDGDHEHIDTQVNPTLYYYIASIPAKQLSNGFFSFQTKEKVFIDNVDIENRYYLSSFYNNKGISKTGIAPTEYNAYKITAEFPTGYRFNDFQSILVLSNIPIRQETIPQATGQLSAYLPNKLSYIATLPVVSDFRAAVSKYSDQNSELIYYPPGEYRWIDLLYDGPLDRLLFDFRYQLIDQSVHQIMLSPGDSVSLKIYFKSIYK
jgi:hypothetical protein